MILENVKKEKTVFFLTNMWPYDESRGITKKSFSQIEAMNNIGIHVSYYTGYVDNGVSVFDEKGNEIYHRQYKMTNEKLLRIFRNKTLKKTALIFLKSNRGEIDYLYSRWFYFDPIVARIFQIAKKRNMKTILELHSYPCYFLKKVAQYPLYLWDFIFRILSKRYIDRIAAMTNRENIWGIETINFENGINLNKIRPIQRCREEGIIRLIAVSYEWEVHGYDRIIKGLRNYYNNQKNEYTIYVVLVGTVMDKTKKLIDNLKLNDYITLAGIQKGGNLDAIYDKCDIGIGCLALHRRSNSAVSDLKTREYTAKGLPYVFAGNQLGVDDKFKYAYKLPEGEDPIDIKQIVSFYNSYKDDDGIPEKMRKWAEQFSWDKQMGKIFEGI